MFELNQRHFKQPARPEPVEGLPFPLVCSKRKKDNPSTGSGRAGWDRGALLSAILLLAIPLPAIAQEMDPNMPGMDHGAMGHSSNPAPCGVDLVGASDAGSEIDFEIPRSCVPAQGSGTSRLPAREGSHHGLHIMPGGGWMLMLHGYVTGVYTKQTGLRGDDKLYAQSMAMLTAEKDFGGAKLQLRSMLSLEPLMTHEGYPNLFATGETAGGNPLVDRQHPHDLFMELAARVDVPLGDTVTAYAYGGPVGEPALGPSAFMHRRSAKYNPEAPITHHWFDSTHITYGVVTGGIATRTLQFEASAFRGAEPDERRWNIETPKLDSWSVRASWNPSPNWALQISHGFLKTPEALEPGNEHRTTASLHFATNRVAAMIGFSAKNKDPGRTLTAWIGEANYDISDHHTLFGRFENVKNDELFPDPLSPFHERPFRVSKFQIGYAWNTALGQSPFNLALGGTVSAFIKPTALDTAYGRHPMGMTLFAKFSLGH
jgi:hypothetical protein